MSPFPSSTRSPTTRSSPRPDFLERRESRHARRGVAGRGASPRAAAVGSRDSTSSLPRSRPLQHATGAGSSSNDRVDVALASGARGVQLTSRSMLVADARRVAARPRDRRQRALEPDARAGRRAGCRLARRRPRVRHRESHPGDEGRGRGLHRQLTRRDACRARHRHRRRRSRARARLCEQRARTASRRSAASGDASRCRRRGHRLSFRL